MIPRGKLLSKGRRFGSVSRHLPSLDNGKPRNYSMEKLLANVPMVEAGASKVSFGASKGKLPYQQGEGDCNGETF